MGVVTTHIEHHIAKITMDRPAALNAFNAQMFDDLCDAFLAAAADEKVKVAVLTGAGRAFSAGADLKAGRGGESRHGLEGLLFALIDFPKPLIVAANGVGAGIGCTIFGLSDMTYVAESSRFRCPFSALGLTAEASSTYTFPRMLGHQRASWILLSSQWISARECVDAGLALEVFADDEFMDKVIEKATILAKLPLASLIKTKELLRAPHRQAMRDAVLTENIGLNELVGGPANVEAIKAFADKREPDFSTY